MININYQTYGTKGFCLRLRLYKDGETKFINVNKMLKGDLQKKHWNPKKKCFNSNAPYAEENNDTLNKFKGRYEEASVNWSGSLAGFIISLDNASDGESDKKTVKQVIDIIVEKLKENGRNPDGTIAGGYEPYLKVVKRLEEFCRSINTDFYKLVLDDMTPQFVNKFLKWTADKGTGKCLYVSQTLHSILAKATKYGWYDIKQVENCNWMKKSNKSAKKYETLTDEQCRRFLSLGVDELPKSKLSMLYRDFCVFILYTCQSTCDGVSLRYSDIQCIDGVDCFVFKRRKIASKQSVDCMVPINSTMREIMDRWKDQSRDGYIFPIRSKERIKANKVNNGDIKHFISRINTWLKKLSPIIGCKFNLHTYVFRHTGITHYISSGASHVYVANLAGTSVSNIEKIYYNNRADEKNRNIVMNALMF